MPGIYTEESTVRNNNTSGEYSEKKGKTKLFVLVETEEYILCPEEYRGMWTFGPEEYYTGGDVHVPFWILTNEVNIWFNTVMIPTSGSLRQIISTGGSHSVKAFCLWVQQCEGFLPLGPTV